MYSLLCQEKQVVVYVKSYKQNNGNSLKKWGNVDIQEFENHLLSILVSLLKLDSVLNMDVVNKRIEFDLL